MKTKAFTLLVATAVASLTLAATASPAGAHTPPSTLTRCNVHIFTNPGTVTFHGWVYARTAYSVLQYWVRVKNVNILGWLGNVSPNGANHMMYLTPFGSHWAPSPAIFLAPRQRAYYYSVTVSPNSDASALAVEVYAPRCS